MSQWKILKQKPRLSPNVGIPIPRVWRSGSKFWYDRRRNRYWIPFNVCGVGTRSFFCFHPILHPSNQDSDQPTHHLVSSHLLDVCIEISSWSSCAVLVFSISSCTLSSHNSSSLLIVTSTSSMMATIVVWERKKERKKEDVLILGVNRASVSLK